MCDSRVLHSSMPRRVEGTPPRPACACRDLTYLDGSVELVFALPCVLAQVAPLARRALSSSSGHNEAEVAALLRQAPVNDAPERSSAGATAAGASQRAGTRLGGVLVLHHGHFWLPD